MANRPDAEASAAEELRERMVAELKRRGAIKTHDVGNAFLAVPRHLFVPGVTLERAYSAREAIPIRHDPAGVSTSSSSVPSIMATMIEQLKPEPGDRVLEIGAGSGYNAGILASLVGPDGSVTSVDLQDDVVQEAQENLRRSGFGGVSILPRDGWLGARRMLPSTA